MQLSITFAPICNAPKNVINVVMMMMMMITITMMMVVVVIIVFKEWLTKSQ